MARIKTLVARNASEARGMRKAFKALGRKFKFTGTRGGKKKRNPTRARRRTKKARSKSRRKR